MSKELEALIAAAGGVIIFNIIKVIYELIKARKEK